MEEGITSPSEKMQAKLMEELYAECNVDPNCVDFVEAHGTGTKVRNSIIIIITQKEYNISVSKF